MPQGKGYKGGYKNQYKKRKFNSPSKGHGSYRSFAANNKRTGGYMGKELKFFDNFLAEAAIAGTVSDMTDGEADPTTEGCLFSPSIGSAVQNRDGRKVFMKSVFVTGNIRVPPQDAQTQMDSGLIVFLALVLDKQTNNAQLDSESVYINPNNQSPSVANPLRNLLNSARFRVLDTVRIDSLQNLNAGVEAADTIDIQGKMANFVLKAQLDITTLFNSGVGTVADIVDNSLHVLAYATHALPAATIAYNCRTRFTD